MIESNLWGYEILVMKGPDLNAYEDKKLRTHFVMRRSFSSRGIFYRSEI